MTADPLPILTAEADGWPALRRHVLLRDGKCIFSYLGPIVKIGVQPIPGDSEHFCRDRYGEPIPWHRLRGSILDLADRGAVELDHVKLELALSKKAPDSSAFLATVCYAAHHGGLATSKAGRQHEREWLSALYPVPWTVFLERQGLAGGD
jgi:hypothetical protein